MADDPYTLVVALSNEGVAEGIKWEVLIANFKKRKSLCR
jgi:hypothetical protein